MDLQLRERRQAFSHRHESLQRIQVASGELEQRIAEVELQDKRLAGLQWRLDSMAEQARALAQDALVPEAAAAAGDSEQPTQLRSSAV
jgi:hypothetical protein